jgi:hypothetical protein
MEKHRLNAGFNGKQCMNGGVSIAVFDDRKVAASAGIHSPANYFGGCWCLIVQNGKFFIAPRVEDSHLDFLTSTC